MESSRRLCFNAEGRPIEFGTWLCQTQRYLTNQRQDGANMYAHASGALQAPRRPEPLPAEPPPTLEARAPTCQATPDSKGAGGLRSSRLGAGRLGLPFPPSLLLVPLLLCRSLRTLQLLLPLTGRNGARAARKGGRGVAAVEEVAVVEAALGAAVVAAAVVHQAEGGLEEVLTHLLEGVRLAMVRGPSSSSHSRDSNSRDNSSGRHHNMLPPPRRPLPCTLGSWATTPRWACLLARKIPIFELSMDDARQYAFLVFPRSSTTLPCPVVPSGVLRGLHIPSFTRNLVGVGYLQDRGITATFVGGGRTGVCTDAATGAVLATFTREPRSGLYVLHTERSPVASFAHVTASPPVPVSSLVFVSSQVVVSGQVAASCSCRSLAHPTVLWHHRLGHPSLPRFHSMASHSLVSSLPRVFLSLPPSLAPPCTPCVAGRLRATLHSSFLRPATAPFETLHLDIWGPAPTLGPERERYFLVVVNDYSRYCHWQYSICGPRSRGVGVGGAGTGGASSGGAGAGGAGTGGANSGGAGAGGPGSGGASSRGTGAGGIGAGCASFGGAGAGGAGAVGASTEETGAGGSPTAAPTAPPHHHDTCFQALRRLEREEQEQLEQERQELQQLDQQHSPPHCSPPVCVLPSPPESSLTVSSHPITDYYRAACPVVSHVLASLVTDPRASSSSVSALTVAVPDFASTRHLDYATRVVAAPPPCPLSVGSESAFGWDVLEDMQFKLEFLAAASSSLWAMLLSVEGDPDALDIPTHCTYHEAVSGKWAS
ncbi:unnamed protein product [Closterium sp. NIES-54]